MLRSFFFECIHVYRESPQIDLSIYIYIYIYIYTLYIDI